MKTYFVYILRCADNSYYVGVTNDLQRRFDEHQNGFSKVAYTYTKRPVQIALYELYTDIDSAIAREKQIQKWSRSKKEALINRDIKTLKALSKGKS